MLRILIADDHDVVRYGLRKVLQAQPGWEVVAEATNGKDAIRDAVATKPDVAVLDCMMPLINGTEATRQILLRAPKTQVLIFTAHADEQLIAEALRAGARGFILKSDFHGELVTAVQSLRRAQTVFHVEGFGDSARYDVDDPRSERDLPDARGTHSGPSYRRRSSEQRGCENPGCAH